MKIVIISDLVSYKTMSLGFAISFWKWKALFHGSDGSSLERVTGFKEQCDAFYDEAVVGKAFYIRISYKMLILPIQPLFGQGLQEAVQQAEQQRRAHLQG